MRMRSGFEVVDVVVAVLTGVEVDAGMSKGGARPRRRKTAWAAVKAHREIVAACSKVTLSGTSQSRSAGHVTYSAKAPGLSLRLQAPWRNPATRCPC